MGSFRGMRAFQLLKLILFIAATGVSLRTKPVSGSQGPQSYVVYMGPSFPSSSQSHVEKVSSLFASPFDAQDAIIYSYVNFNAFAVKITPDQAATLSADEDVKSVFLSKRNSLHTTHSWAFLGLEDDFGNVPHDSLWEKSDYGSDVVIGVIDSGVWPESKSFDDTGLGPIPRRWKGECATSERFGPQYCNKKLIGGKFFIKGYEAAVGVVNLTAYNDFRSPRDSAGHGTHTTSTAGGSYAPHVSCLGFAAGTAKGGAPKARVAMYKVCWGGDLATGGCYDADILAAFDAGITDGVHVLSLSLGSDPPLPPLFEDAIAIGAFHAVQHNISVIASAGNSGPSPASVSNTAPWITTVAASTIDRDFPSFAILGNGMTIRGDSLSTHKLGDGFYPLVSSANVYASDSNAENSSLCFPGSLDPAKVQGKIVACERGVTARLDKGEVVKSAGGIGLILINLIESADELIADAHVLPATLISYADGIKVMSYINSTSSPVAKLTAATTVIGTKPAPVLTAFSSQGPNSLIPDLLKPDITGPGLNIIAAFTEASSITGLPGDNRLVAYNIISGTSMSCPHVSGTIASLKSYHPTWTPAALHSAIVTTAQIYDDKHEYLLNSSMQVSTPFGIGGGHLAPNDAAEPGLVYDSGLEDYYVFLCSLGYSSADLFSLDSKNYTCPRHNESISNLNYPSISVSNLGKGVILKRTVTNVGYANSKYTVAIESPPGIETIIKPSVLTFSALGEKQTFLVIFKTKQSTDGDYSFGSYTWHDEYGYYSVRSPIAVNTGSS